MYNHVCDSIYNMGDLLLFIIPAHQPPVELVVGYCSYKGIKAVLHFFDSHDKKSQSYHINYIYRTLTETPRTNYHIMTIQYMFKFSI